jgi:hypothetical protein
MLIFFTILALFANFEVKRGQNGLKKRKHPVDCKCVLELNFATITGLVELLKSLNSSVQYTYKHFN